MKKIPLEISTMIFLANPHKTDVEKLDWLNQLPKDFDWDYFTERVWKTSMTGFIMTNHESILKLLPIEKREFLKKVQNRILVHNLILFEELQLICAELNKRKINYAILKGWDVIIRGFYTMNQRQISDIDILINPYDCQNLICILEELKYKVKYLPSKSKLFEKYTELHAPYQGYKNEICIDIHFNIFNIAQNYKVNTQLLIQTSKSIKFKGQIFKILDIENASLFCKLHIYKHIKFDSLKFSSFQDLYYLNSENERKISKLWFGLNDYKRVQRYFEYYQNTTKFKFSNYSLFYTQLIGRNYIITKFRLLMIRWKTRFRFLFINPKLILGLLFPSKEYLSVNFGNGNYLKLLSRRFLRLFKSKK